MRIGIIIFILLVFVLGVSLNAVYHMQEDMIDNPAEIAAELATPKFEVMGGIPVIGHIAGAVAFPFQWIAYFSDLTMEQWDFLQGPMIFIQVILYMVVASFMAYIFISLLTRWRV